MAKEDVIEMEGTRDDGADLWINGTQYLPEGSGATLQSIADFDPDKAFAFRVEE